jgi:hypothetical protein
VGPSCEQFFAIVNFHRIAVGWVELLRHHHAPDCGNDVDA